MNKQIIISTEPPEHITNSVLVPRKFKEDLFEGKITIDEYTCLVLLWQDANPKNAKATITYASFASILSKSPNRVNKIFLELRKKEYIYFKNQRGKKNGVLVELIDYPLSPIKATRVKRYTKLVTSSQEQKQTEEAGRSQAEMSPDGQKLKNDFIALGEKFSNRKQLDKSRTTRNEM